MNARPTPRTSSLAGSTPILPPTTTPVPPAAAPQVQTSTAPKKTKLAFWVTPADAGRIRAAIKHMPADEGPRNPTAFFLRAVMEQVERLEATYNNGRPWPSVPPRELPQGRPMEE